MSYFVKYLKSNGRVLEARSLIGDIPEEDSDFGYLEVESLPELHSYVQDGVMKSAGPKPTEFHVLDSEGKTWIDSRSLVELKQHALFDIDVFAGNTRLKYITSVPGQAETYSKKEAQAREWQAANFEGNPPSFIAAEANALNRQPQEVATEVIVLADYWANIKGPEIEATRRKWKVLVENASTSAEVLQLTEDARAALELL